MRISLGYTADVMAERMEISRGYLSEIENGKSMPSDKVMRHLERLRNVNFLTSEGKHVSKSGQFTDLPYPKFQPAEPLGVHENGVAYRVKTVDVPLFRGVHASAGNGLGVPPDDPPEVHVSFSPSYMRHHFGRSGDGFAMIYVKGDSMQPGLLDGDEIVIDTRHRRVDRDGIYVITLRGDLKVKRIQQRLDGSLVVKSDNPAYEAELVTATQAEEFTVEGRLVWPRLR